MSIFTFREGLGPEAPILMCLDPVLCCAKFLFALKLCGPRSCSSMLNDVMARLFTGTGFLLGGLC